MMTIEETKQELAKRLTQERYEHSLGVADTAAAIARRLDLNEQQAYLAGLLHDCGRQYETEELIDEAKRRGIEVDRLERTVPYLLHSPVGAQVAGEVYGLTDPAVFRAIALHTVGGADMSWLDKIIYFSDMIEPHRDYPGVEELRELSRTASLDTMTLAGINQTINYILSKGRLLHFGTVVARNDLLLALRYADK